MKHVTYAEKALLMGDETAALLLRYDALLASNGDADSVDIRAIGPDGNEVDVSMVLGPGIPLIAEDSSARLADPINTWADAELKDKIAAADPRQMSVAVHQPGLAWSEYDPDTL